MKWTEDQDLNLCEEVLLQEQTSSTLIKKKKKLIRQREKASARELRR